MTDASSMTGLEDFLIKHEPVARPTLCNVGTVLGEWRVTALLGKGGNSEVYRVIRESDGLVAAAKVLLRDDDASKARFRQEAELLSSRGGSHVAKFYAAGAIGDRPYLVIELLEPVDLPESERGIADYLLAVCAAVEKLHRSGLVHRDIKPSNVMRRANGDLVLIDFGLVKDTVKSPGPERDVSVISSKVVAVGTPRFAAPEQLTGGEVTVAADIHAIGRLADELFHADPPRTWLPIIRRATSSIPGRRYPSVSDLAHAIRHRHDRRRGFWAASALVALFLLGYALVGIWRTTVGPALAWRSLCENVATNLVVRELVWERQTTNWVGQAMFVVPERAYRDVQKQVNMTIVRLNSGTNAFGRPICLDPAHEYLIEGPGVLSADLRADRGTVRVRLKNCFLFNRSPVPLEKAGIRYVFEGGVYLNFTGQDKPSSDVINANLEGFDGASNVIDFKGPPKPLGRDFKVLGRQDSPLFAESQFPTARP